MSIHCRTCGEPIYNVSPRNLFKHENEDIRNNIEALTGIKLFYAPHLPNHICSCCYLDLDHSIAFRDRCLETHKNLWAVKQEENIGNNLSLKPISQIDPLDGRNRGKGEVGEEDKDYAKNSDDECDSNIQETKLSNPSHPVLQVGLTNCRDPREDLQKVNRPTAIMGTKSSRNIRAVMVPSHAAPRQKYVTVRPVTSIMAESTMKNERLSPEKKYQPESRNAENSKERKPRKSPKEKRYVCDQCGWSFRDLSNMKDHALRHSGVKKFECEECASRFFTRHLLMLHVRVHHRGEKPFACKYCDMGFRNSPSRCRHERKYHANQLPYECILCNRTFISKISLEKHKILHITGEKVNSYSCETCRKTFKCATSLKNHCFTKFHLRRINQLDKEDFELQEPEMVSEDDFDFPDSADEEIDE